MLVLKIEAEDSRQLTFPVLALCLISLCEVACFSVYFLPDMFSPIVYSLFAWGESAMSWRKTLKRFVSFLLDMFCLCVFSNRAGGLCGLR